MSTKSQRGGSTLNFILGYLAGFGVCIFVTQLSEGDKMADAGKEVQVYNEQIGRQLETDFGSVGDVGRLVLDSESDTFTFVLNGEQTCEGDYVIEKDHAQIDGKLECSYEVGSR